MMRYLLCGLAILAAAVVGHCTGVRVRAEPRALTLAIGVVTANDVEREGCIFAVGNDAAVMLNPHGEFCAILREQIGTTGTLLFVRD